MGRIGRDLVAQAQMLARCDPGRPKQATLRRSISTAYYGLFHYLIEESTRILFGSTAADADYRQLAARAYNHTKMKSACKEFLKTNAHDVHEILKPFWPRLGIPTNADIRLVSQTFVDLQSDRHTGDYDLSISFLRQNALNAVARAESAIVAWEKLKRSAPEVCRLFAVVLILWPGLAGRN